MPGLECHVLLLQTSASLNFCITCLHSKANKRCDLSREIILYNQKSLKYSCNSKSQTSWCVPMLRSKLGEDFYEWGNYGCSLLCG